MILWIGVKPPGPRQFNAWRVNFQLFVDDLWPAGVLVCFKSCVGYWELLFFTEIEMKPQGKLTYDCETSVETVSACIQSIGEIRDWCNFPWRPPIALGLQILFPFLVVMADVSPKRNSSGCKVQTWFTQANSALTYTYALTGVDATPTEDLEAWTLPNWLKGDWHRALRVFCT